jgi:hypothetical protein
MPAPGKKQGLVGPAVRFRKSVAGALAVPDYPQVPTAPHAVQNSHPSRLMTV